MGQLTTERPGTKALDDFPMFSDDLVDGLVGKHRTLAALEAERTEWVAEVVRRHAHEDLGYLSVVSLLVDRLGVSPGVARSMVRIASALVEMPRTRDALAAGDIDMARVRMLVDAHGSNADLFSSHEAILVDSLAGLGAADARRAVDYWIQQADLGAAETDADHLHQRRSLHLSPLMSGLVRIDGNLDPEGGQVVIDALRSLSDPGNLDLADVRTPAQRRADALIELCADHLKHGQAPRSGGEPPQISVLLSLEALEGRAGEPCELEDTGVITPRIARRIACDAKVTRVITGTDSAVLDVGRATRTVPPAIRRALVVRDRGCAIAGCTRRPRWCDAHHIEHWANGGPTKLDNLVLLCRRHHRLVHEGRTRLPESI